MEHIEVIVENKGGRAAYNLKAIALFPSLDSLQLFPVINGKVQTHEPYFNIFPNSKIELWGGWSMSPHLDFSKAKLTMSDFLEKGVPVNIVVSGEKLRKEKALPKSKTIKIFQDHNEALYS